MSQSEQMRVKLCSDVLESPQGARILAFPDLEPPYTRLCRRRALAIIVASNVSDAGVDAILAIGESEQIKLPGKASQKKSSSQGRCLLQKN